MHHLVFNEHSFEIKRKVRIIDFLVIVALKVFFYLSGTSKAVCQNSHCV